MQIVLAERTEHSVELLCELMSVTSSSYYRWIQTDHQGIRSIEDQQLKEKIKAIHEGSRKIYGSPRIEKSLRKAGVKTSKKRVLRLMKEQGLKGCYNERKRPKTTDSKHSNRISNNFLKVRDFPTRPKEVVVVDTTYVWTDSGWHYLATVMDLFNREILGWSFSSNNDRHLVCQALWNASGEFSDDELIIHHSDRGSTYCSDEYRKLLDELGMVSSMSAQGYCYDNAHMESFFGSLKSECRELDESLSAAQVKLVLFDYIEGFYNTHRIHTALGSMSPREYRQSYGSPRGGCHRI